MEKQTQSKNEKLQTKDTIYDGNKCLTLKDDLMNYDDVRSILDQFK